MHMLTSKNIMPPVQVIVCLNIVMLQIYQSNSDWKL